MSSNSPNHPPAIPEAVQGLVEKWRSEADGSRIHDRETGDVCGYVWDRCADELEAALRRAQEGEQ